MVVTQISPCAKNKKRVNIYADGEFAFACHMEIAQEEDLRVGRVLTEREVADIREKDSADWAWRTAVAYATGASRTEKQVRDKLISKGIAPEAADEAVQRLREYRMVDDEEFARDYAEVMYRKYGRWTVVRKLRERGISNEIISRVTENPGDEDVLFDLARRLMERHAGEERPRRVQKVTRSLSAKGFEFDDIRRAIERCESGEDGDDA